MTEIFARIADRLRHIRLLIIILVAAPLFAQEHVYARDIVLKNAKFIDPQTKTATVKDIWIINGRINTEVERDRKSAPQVLDLTGKWIIPALIDLHVHCSGNPLPNGDTQHLAPRETARIMLYAGVCAFLDLAYTHFDRLFADRDHQRADPAGSSDEADIYCAGGAFGNWVLSSPEAAPPLIKHYIAKWKPDVIKLIYGRHTLDRATLISAIKAANEAHVKTVVHIGSWEHAGDAIDGGATCVTHFFDDEPIPDSLVAAWAKSKTVSIPTMAVQFDMANFVEHPNLLASPLLKALAPPNFVKSYRDSKHFSDKANETVQWQKDDRENDLQSFRKLHAAGVPMLAGSDTDNLGTAQGFSLHREIRLMQQAGYSSWEALAAATTNAAKFLGRPTGVATGDVAELVVLDADPIADIDNTQKIFAVIHHGVIVDRAKLLNSIER